MSVASMLPAMFLMSSIRVSYGSGDNFILSVPQVLKNNLELTKTDSGLKPSVATFYSAPWTSTPSSFYQVPGLSSEEPPPIPSTSSSSSTSNTNAGSNLNNNQESSGASSNSGTILPRPGALSTADRFFIVPSSASSLPSSSSVSSSNTNKLVAQPLSATTALLVAFLLSLIPTLAISLPFFAFRRRRRVPITFLTGTGRLLDNEHDQEEIKSNILNLFHNFW